MCKQIHTLSKTRAAPSAHGGCTPLEQHPKALPVLALLDSLGLVLAPCPNGKPSCSPPLPHGKVVSGLSRVVCLPCACACLPSLLSLCSRWRMAAVPPCHGTAGGTGAAGHVSVWLLVAARPELGAQEQVLPGWLGKVGGDVWGLSPRTCSGSPPSPWFEGVPPRVLWLRVLPGSRSPNRSTFGTPLPSTADPGDQLSGNLFCLESSQVFFLVQSCSNCPKSTRQLDCQEDRRKRPTSPT